ncbi:subtilase-type protease inhibitor [Nocardia mexicana]|uniref:Subtilisin inhibitor-like n=1 Tax=Nocardia mexicana TaxID=279262 RepID=A0A370GMK2_9NOCA|nr:subtilase-type protease inhibitor [Nocardia mexicana]RDI44509.1 subtilisin inhibitor-like [Nocardia mexicana]
MPKLFRPLLIASGVLLTGAAIVAPAGADPAAESQVTLTVARGEAGAPVEREVALSCQPRGGTHPDVDAACEALAAVDGDFDALRAQESPRMCTKIWDPVTVTATGQWNGRPVDYTRTFGNSCEREGASAVLRF